MYCPKCGTKLNDDNQYCYSCGAPTLTSIPSPSVDGQIEPTYNREVLKLHLKGLRFLEMARARLNSNIVSIDRKVANLGHPKYINVPTKKSLDGEYVPVVGWLIAGLVVFLIGWGIVAARSAIDKHRFSNIGGYIPPSTTPIVPLELLSICVIIALFFIVKAEIRRRQLGKQYQNDLQIYGQTIAGDQARVQLEIGEINRLRSIRPAVAAELDRVKKLLESTYDVDFVPSQFRSLYAVYFLYDFMSTSRESFSSALIHYNLNEIKAKLDKIIEQQQEMILNEHIMMAQNQEMINQNKQQIAQNNDMLGHAIEIEHNTEIAAKYSQVAARNTDLIAFCTAAQFLYRM